MPCGLFSVDAVDFEKMRESISCLRRNDASFTPKTETSAALGWTFGLLRGLPADAPRGIRTSAERRGGGGFG